MKGKLSISPLINELPGPILVVGASGFVGANLLRQLLEVREDVVGTFFSGDSWRLQGIPTGNTYFLNLHDQSNVRTERWSPFIGQEVAVS